MRYASLLMTLAVCSMGVAWGVDVDAQTLENDTRTLRTIRVGADALRRPVHSPHIPPGAYVFTIHHGGYLRDYEIHVPPSYNGEPVPLVVVFHAFGDTGTVQPNASGFLRESDEEGFIVAWPTGLERCWNTGGLCCGFAARNEGDDVRFAKAGGADVAERTAIDETRGYATGASNGGGLTHLPACEAADVFAAVAPTAIPLPTEGAVDCRPERPIPVVDFHGLHDNTVAYDGSPALRGAVESLEAWASINWCVGPPVRILEQGNSVRDA